VAFDRANRYTVQTGPGDAWPADRVNAVRLQNPGAMPTAREKIRTAGFMIRYAPGADLLHVVASLNRPSRWAADTLRAWRAVFRKPVIHTVPSIGDAAPDRRHFAGDLTVVVSDHTRDLLMEAGVANVARVYPPLDERKLAAAPELVGQLRAEHALGDRAVLYPAHYGPDSGIKEMIEAFTRLPEELNDAVLVMACRTHVGQDPEQEAQRVATWAAEAGIGDRVRVLGNVKAMPALIRACAVTALVPARLSSKMDLPLVVLEALALGRPAIVADRAPMSEGLLGNGGFAVPFGDIPALAVALARLLQDPRLREELGARGRAAVLNQCDPERVARRYEEFYEWATAQTRRYVEERTKSDHAW
jgi:phosphatidylinositol alpha-1,6-mannosyltransferase